MRCLWSSLSASEIPVLEHVLAIGRERPVIPLSRLSFFPRDFHKAIVQTQIMSNRILPPLLVVMVIWESVHNELVDAVQSDFLVGGVANRHRDQRDVGVRGLLGGFPALERGHGAHGQGARKCPFPEAVEVRSRRRGGEEVLARVGGGVARVERVQRCHAA